MNIFDAIILGVVEGITEFLPVSSTGHMILVGHMLGLGEDSFVRSFEIIIQLGAILAVIFLYKEKLVRSRSSLLKILIAFIPTAVIGLSVYSFAKKYLLGNDLVVIMALLVGGLALVLFERCLGKGGIRERLSAESSTQGMSPDLESKPESLDMEFQSISNTKAIYLGLWQALAIVPGVSRSAATIIGGEVMGVPRKTIVEFSFLLAIPTMLSATALDLYKHADAFQSGDLVLLSVGFVTAFFVALLAIKSFIAYIQKHSFASFGYYRMFVAVLYAWFFLL